LRKRRLRRTETRRQPPRPTRKHPLCPWRELNSFTERIEAAGYTDVTALKLDDKGVWQANAKKGQ